MQFRWQSALFRHGGYSECYLGVRDFSHNIYEPNTSALLYFHSFYLSNTNSAATFMTKLSQKYSVDSSGKTHVTQREFTFSLSAVISELSCYQMGKNSRLLHGSVVLE